MKTLLMLSIVILSSISQASNLNALCEDKINTAARSLWSVNSGIDMKDLTAQILRQNVLKSDLSQFTVVVNTPRFPQMPQRVPYNVVVVPKKTSQDCMVTQVTALTRSRFAAEGN